MWYHYAIDLVELALIPLGGGQFFVCMPLAISKINIIHLYANKNYHRSYKFAYTGLNCIFTMGRATDSISFDSPWNF